MRIIIKKESLASKSATLRISLENTQTRERRGFTDLEAMLAFLRASMETCEAREESPKMQ